MSPTFIQYLIEARYYGRHSRKDVIKQYTRAIDKGKFKHVPRSSFSEQNVFLRSMEVTDNFLWGDIFVKDATGPEEDVKEEINQYLKKMNVPITEIYDIAQHRHGSGESWEATTVLELDSYRDDKLNEAQYYRRHSVEDVHNQYRRIIANPQQSNNEIGLIGTHKADNKVFATVYAYNVKNEQQFRNMVEQFMKDNKAPYDTLLDIEDTDEEDDDDNYSFFQGIIVYKQHKLNEAKYYRQLSLLDANKEYQDAYEKGHDARGVVKMQRPELFRFHRGDYISCDFLLPQIRETEAIQAVKQFADKYKIPHNQLKVARVTEEQYPHSKSYWRVILRYVPQLTEAQYYKSHSADDVAKHYKDVQSMTDNPRTSVAHKRNSQVSIDWIEHESMSVTVGISVWDVNTEDEFRRVVERFLERFNCPYTHITNISNRDRDYGEMVGNIVYREKQ